MRSKNLNWVTRGLEFLMVFFSLLWAVEATSSKRAESTATKATASFNGAQRAPAYAPAYLRMLLPSSPLMGFNDPRFVLPRMESLSVLKPGEFQAPDSVLAGDNVSSSVKKSSFFVPSSLELFRFQTDKLTAPEAEFPELYSK